MKKLLFSISLLFCAMVALQAATITVTGDITSNKTWNSNNIYVLAPGFHYVKNNATLTIKPGTIIKGDGGTLVVTKGSKIMAVGTALQPIVFTSNQPAGSRAAGDWGGLVILGKAPINVTGGSAVVEGGLDTQLGSYGGTDANDNSGQLSYVRIEYAGKFYQPNNELNSLTLGGVGAGTIINNVQVSRGLDDGFEWFGGNSNAKYLVSYASLDDDFDTDFGYSGNVQFGVVLRDPNAADVSGSNGFESDNDATGSTNAPFTSAKFSNITVFGPMQGTGNTFNSNYRRGAHLRRSTKQDIRNSVFVGWPTGLRIENTNTGNFAVSGDLEYKNNLLAGNTLNFEAVSTTGFDITAWFAANSNNTYPTVADAAYNNVYGATPNFKAQAASPVLSGASFTGLPSFFAATSYRGAFNTAAAWTDCWCEFDVQNQAYNTKINYIPTAAITPAGPVTVGTALTATAGTGYTYKWYKGTTAIAGGASVQQTYTPTTAGTYRCKITTARGCVKFTPYVTVNQNLTVEEGIEVQAAVDNKILETLEVFPNPATDFVTVGFMLNSTEGNVSIQIVNMMGQQVFARTVEATEGMNYLTVDANTLANGVYFVRVSNASERMEQKLVKH